MSIVLRQLCCVLLPMNTLQVSQKLYTAPFLLLCLSHALFAASFNMILPELPNFLTHLGGAHYKGYIIALFTLTACISRPFSGKLTDTIGRLPVMYIGAIACVVCSLLYPHPLLATVGGFLLLRFLHGFSTGFKPTGTAAYVADVAPHHRLGEAMGILGISMSLGASASPLLGSWLVQHYTPSTMFYVSAALALGSIVVLFNLPETLVHKQKFRFALLRIKRQDIFDPLAIPAGIVMLFCYASYGVILTLTPDLSDHLGVVNRGVFFSIFTLASVTMRFGAGKLSDRLGRVPVLKASALVIGVAMGVLAHADSALIFYCAAAIFGFGNGIFSPAINAWTIDLGDPERKGRALATMFIALEIAIGGGALLAGWYFDENYAHMPAIFYFAGVMSFSGWVYLFFWERRRRKRVNLSGKF